MLGRTFEDGYGEHASLLLDKEVSHLLRGDVVTGNLECLVTSARKPNPLAHANFRTSPTFARPLLELFDVVTMANNHVYDFFDVGIEDTLRYLDEIGVEAVGVGKSEAEAVEPAVLRRNGHEMAVFGLATAAAEPPEASHFVIARPGRVAYERIRQAREAGQVVVVHLHAGGGDVAHPPPEVRTLHEHLFRAGADVVLGHHPHRPQGWLVRPEGVQFFSLGDFVFDRFQDGRDTALVATLRWKDTLHVEVNVVRRGEDFRVRRSDGVHAEHWNASLEALNRALADGTSNRLFFEEASQQAGLQLHGLVRDIRSGGWMRFFRRVGRVGPRRIVTMLRVLSQRVLRLERNRQRTPSAPPCPAEANVSGLRT